MDPNYPVAAVLPGQPEGAAALVVCPVDCRFADTFTLIIEQVLQGLAGPDADGDARMDLGGTFGEHTLGELRAHGGRLAVVLKDSDRLRGAVLDSLLEYLQQAACGAPVYVVVDSVVCYERLPARTRYAARLRSASTAGIVPGALALLEDFLHELRLSSGVPCLLSAGVLDFLREHCEAAQLPFCRVREMVKFCLLSTVTRSPLGDPGAWPAEAADRVGGAARLEALRPALDGLLANSAAAYTLVLLLLPDSVTRLELQKMLLRPGFGTCPMLDQVDTLLPRRQPEDVVRLLVRLEVAMQQHSGALAAQVLRVCAASKAEVRDRAGIVRAAAALKAALAEAALFDTGHACAPLLVFSAVGRLQAAFVPDMAATLHHALKHPEAYTADGRLAGARPDMCVVYRLTLEWQRLINLHDLYMQFQSKVHAGPRKPRADEQRVLLARFQHAVTELELMGVVGAAGRRRDFVERRNLTDQL